MSFNLLIVVSLSYVSFLFLVAFMAERRARQGRDRWLRSPLVYTLSLSVYCTAWTFYGAVGYAARSGLEYVTIYLGPTLILIGWWLILRKLVRVGRTQRITSIADLISSRYGKSNTLGVLVTAMAVVGTTPYIALQLQSVTLSIAVFAAEAGEPLSHAGDPQTALWVAVGLAIFTVLFGTRNLDANERHHGVVMAIAVEAVVKLLALLAVGAFVVWGLAGGVGEVLTRIDSSPIAAWQIDSSRWLGLTFLSAAAILCLPRMFQVLVVENADEGHLATASWAFPLYVLLMSLFVVPIAVMGLAHLPAGSNPDLFVLTLPLSEGRGGLALFAFLGGLSSATSMVIVAAIALSTMVSNHIVLPLWLARRQGGAVVSGDMRRAVLTARRVSIAAVLALGYGYYRFSGGTEALASIGLISFAGVAQVLPAMLGGLFWRGATGKGAIVGLVVGFAVWAYCLFLPSFGPDGVLSASLLSDGPFGIGWLRPRALFGIEGMDPLVHAIFWSMVLNTAAFCAVSIASFPTPLERLQSAQVVNVFHHTVSPGGWVRGAAEAEDLLMMSQRILGTKQAQSFFRSAAQTQGKAGLFPDTTPEFLSALERELSGSVGSATAHAMVGQIAGSSALLVEDLLRVADETQQILEYSSQLELKSAELARTAEELKSANEKLTVLSVQKDAFLSQISHELRTPMTSIRAFSDILGSGDLTEPELERYSGIIHAEANRLTRILDDLLDLSVLENAQVSLNIAPVRLGELLDQAVSATGVMGDAGATPMVIHRDAASESRLVETDADRLTQVFINLIGNARKYCDAEAPELTISVAQVGDTIQIDFADNGSGISLADQKVIFEKFARLTEDPSISGAGLGLAICREIMLRLGGSVDYVQTPRGPAFRLRLPAQMALAAQ
ncbi:sodium:solute symporter [Alphaproteobacteria bacterium KMM 3653]|uniref:histidine kinase n=1 Tax=Harenicola maris TaxID=2841044 RepID=A0AAP2CRK2_9RHOB|nr:sodium:solute symporter [Harenicola maris]